MKRATIEFAEGLGVGVLASEEVTFTVRENYSDALLAMSVSQHLDEMVKDVIEVEVQEIQQEQT